MPSKHTHDTVPEGCFDVHKEMKWYTLYYAGEAIPLSHSDSEHKDKVRKSYCGANNARSKPVIKMDMIGNVLAEYECSALAAELHGVTPSTISQVCNGKGKTAVGFKWAFKINNNGTNK